MSPDKAAAQSNEQAPASPDSDTGSTSAPSPDMPGGPEPEPGTSADAAISADGVADTGDSNAHPGLEQLQQQLDEQTARADKNAELVLRAQADMDNLRKRQKRELENAHKFALDNFAKELLPVRDSLEMGLSAAGADDAAMESIVEGAELTLKMLTQALEKFNIVEIDPQGQKFDPDLHQAMSMQEGTDQPANTVLTVMQKGYTLNDRVIRPAMVMIAK